MYVYLLGYLPICSRIHLLQPHWFQLTYIPTTWDLLPHCGTGCIPTLLVTCLVGWITRLTFPLPCPAIDVPTYLPLPFYLHAYPTQRTIPTTYLLLLICLPSLCTYCICIYYLTFGSQHYLVVLPCLYYSIPYCMTLDPFYGARALHYIVYLHYLTLFIFF